MLSLLLALLHSSGLLLAASKSLFDYTQESGVSDNQVMTLFADIHSLVLNL